MFKRITVPRWLWPAAAILVVLVVLPLVIPRFYVYVLTLIFVTALLAMSLNLALGHGGIFQFHHGVFYGVGAYTIALVMVRASLPMWVGMIAGPIVAALAGLLIGWFCVRLTRLYFGMLQISLGSLIWAIVFKWRSFTGADDGLIIPMPEILSSERSSYYFILIILVVCLIALYIILKSPFGATLQAIRDNPQRCEAVGVNVRRHQLIAIVIASFFGGVAGVLYVVVEHFITPDLLFWTLSLEILVMCLLGGWFTFAGPILGATIMVALRTFWPKLSGQIVRLIADLADLVSLQTAATWLRDQADGLGEYWTLILGVILILLIFFLPEGLMGFLLKQFRPRKQPEGG